MTLLWKIILFLRGPLGDLLKAFIKAAWAYSKPEVREVLDNAINMVKQDPSLILDEDKRKAAFEDIKMQLELKGIKIRDHIINMLIEVRVAVLKVFNK